MSVKTKKKGWFKVCPEKWLFGSTREEMTPAERGVWIDFLALAYMNDPPGQIDFFTERRLANKLNITTKLLRSTIEKASAYGKIDLDGTPIASKFDEKKDKTGSKRDQHDSKRGELVSSRSKFGIPQRTIKILKWNEYQSEYLRQKPYRQNRYEEEESREDEKEHDEKLQNSSPKSVTQVTDRGEERRGERMIRKFQI